MPTEAIQICTASNATKIVSKSPLNSAESAFKTIELSVLVRQSSEVSFIVCPLGLQRSERTPELKQQELRANKDVQSNETYNALLPPPSDWGHDVSTPWRHLNR